MHCRHHRSCPGCPLIELPYPAQLAEKRARLSAALARYGHLPQAPPVAGASRAEGYRHRLKLPLQVERDHVAIGLLHPRTGRVVDTPDCPVLHPKLREALPPLLDQLRGRSGLHALDLRVSSATGQLQAVLACAGGELPGGKFFARKLIDGVPGLASVAVSVADPERKRVMGRAPRVLAGLAALPERIGSTSYTILPGAFFQVDPENAATLHLWVREGLGSAQRVLDLYAGVGAYARMLAPGRQRVVAVEEVPAAAEAARRGAPPNLVVVQGRAEDVLLEERFDAAVINPARRGSDPTLLRRLAERVPRLVYVSCGPETLARDLDCLAAWGLRVSSIQALDLFPQTPEVEAVVTLDRGPALTRWPVHGGEATGPWRDRPSGALGRPECLIALVIGDPGPRGKLPGGSFERLAVVATHGLVRVTLRGEPGPALDALARRGHPLAWEDRRTRAFFEERIGLVRPFLHVERAGGAYAPLHGDLATALETLGHRWVAPSIAHRGRSG